MRLANSVRCCALCRQVTSTERIESTVRPIHAGLVVAHTPVAVHHSHVTRPVLACDLCSAPDPVWSYRTAPQVMFASDGAGRISPLAGSDPTWAAYTTCAFMIELGNPGGVVARAAAQITVKRGLPPGNALAAARSAHTGFWAHLEPGRTPLAVTGRPVAAPAIAAGQLPAVRDRWATWWLDEAAHTGVLHRPGHRWPVPPQIAPSGRIPLDDSIGVRQQVAGIAASLTGAQLFWIDPAFAALAQQMGSHLPELRIDRTQVPARDGLVVWGEPIGGGAETPFGDPVVAAHWTRRLGGWWITFATATGADLDTVALATLRAEVGWLWPAGPSVFLPDQPAPPTARAHDRWLRALVATWALIDQPLAQVDDTAADTPTVREYARRHLSAPQIRVVTIRPRPTTSRPASTRPGRPEPEYRSLVHAHWRWQACGPRYSQHRWTLIGDHFRGPDDKPVRITPTVHALRPPRPRDPVD